MSHTPGPWKVRYFGLTQDGDPYHFIEAGDGGRVGERWMNVSGCIEEDDARLIAAAPDMLEALEGIMATYPTSANTKFLIAIELARNVIAKAKVAG